MTTALWLGVGCKRDTPRAVIEQAVRSVLRANQLAEDAIAGVATIDRKVNETGLVQFCRDRALPLYSFSADQLRSVTVPNPSLQVEAEVGIPSVAEAAAMLAACSTTAATIARERQGQFTITNHHPAAVRLRVPKTVVQTNGEPGAVTIAIAESGLKHG